VENRKPKKPGYVPSVAQIWKEFRGLKTRVEAMAKTVSELKEMLNTTDNWHSRISNLIGKKIVFRTVIGPEPTDGRLLYSDRYTIGIEVEGQERLYNKGQIMFVAPAE